jgi:hypothetical protein
MSSLLFRTQPLHEAAVTYSFFIRLPDNHLKVYIRQRQRIAIVERHLYIRLQRTLVKLGAIRRVLIGDTPSGSGIIPQLRMGS